METNTKQFLAFSLILVLAININIDIFDFGGETNKTDSAPQDKNNKDSEKADKDAPYDEQNPITEEVKKEAKKGIIEKILDLLPF